ncbi:sulfatase family protein [Fulvitalea axinellae]|uniref:sulfatase family protein n=1 Tax=Fulvitalea axinellae TaxID=1182444 RepID=UPI0030CA35C6
MKKSGVAVTGMAMLPQVLAAKRKQGKRPNLIYVFPDQMRRQAMGFWKKDKYRNLLNGDTDPVHTPSLDKFADESVVFTQVTSTSPICSPHRAMLFSGKYPHKNGVLWNCRADRENQLDPEAECFGDVLKKSGYSCGYIGKYHMDKPEANDPDRPGYYVNGATRPEQRCWDAFTPVELRHGFDYWYSYGTFDVHKNPHYWDSNGKKHEPGIWSPIHEADKAISYINNEENQRDEEKPFFLVVSMNPPHGPYYGLKDTDEDVFNEFYSKEKQPDVDELLNRPNVPADFGKCRKAVRYYMSHVTGVDREFGRIVEAVDKSGKADETIIVFASDHGEMMGSHGKMGKTQLYEEAFGIPFIVRYPEKLKPATSDLLMDTPDIMPSLLGLMGLKDSIPEDVQGADYSKFFLKPKKKGGKPEVALFITHGNGRRGLRTDTHSIMLSDKLEEGITLFDNIKDPYQQTPLDIDKNKKLSDDLLGKLANRLREIEDPWFVDKTRSDVLPYGKV